jgi:hypothetical protein
MALLGWLRQLHKRALLMHFRALVTTGSCHCGPWPEPKQFKCTTNLPHNFSFWFWKQISILAAALTMFAIAIKSPSQKFKSKLALLHFKSVLILQLQGHREVERAQEQYCQTLVNFGAGAVLPLDSEW